MLTLTYMQLESGFPSTSLFFDEFVARVFFRNDRIGGHPTT